MRMFNENLFKTTTAFKKNGNPIQINIYIQMIK